MLPFFNTNTNYSFLKDFLANFTKGSLHWEGGSDPSVTNVALFFLMKASLILGFSDFRFISRKQKSFPLIRLRIKDKKISLLLYFPKKGGVRYECKVAH